jgi:DNA-binding transcriptional MerR regulator/methanogenic corrinoid protein MtbC1
MNQLDEQTASEAPLYNIGIVSRMTGILIATLRIWERRYGFPHSARTAGGHRLYSEHEVMRLRWIKARHDEGMQPRQAIQAMQHLEREGRFPEAPLAPITFVQQKENGISLAVFRENFTAAMALVPLEDLVLDVIVPAMSDIGEAWVEGRATVATEHLATHYLRHRLVMWTLTGPPTHPVRPVVLACAPGELHEGSLLAMGVLLRRQRWPVVYLGQTVPLPDLATLVQEIKPPAVVLVAMTEESSRALAEWPRWFPEAARTKRPVIAFGGRVFSEQAEWRDRVPGIFLGATLQEGLDRLQQLLSDVTALAP